MEFNYQQEEDFGSVNIEERGNTFTSLRKVRWNENSEFKTDLRKYYLDKAGVEKVAKGGIGLSDEGWDRTVEALCQKGYGDTKTILVNIKDREDFKPALKSAMSGEDLEDVDVDLSDVESDDFFNPEEIL